ncbi:MAG: DNA-binding protein HU [Alphaproteobacteria bacterium]|nr:DNA-binding protein HU [Alphaproteobacteria bacterium]
MNKAELIDAIANDTGLPRAQAQDTLEAVLSTITKALSQGEEVRLVNFGTFVTSTRAASEGRNPRTGEKIQIPASKQPKFKAGKELKEAVNKK